MAPEIELAAELDSNAICSPLFVVAPLVSQVWLDMSPTAWDALSGPSAAERRFMEIAWQAIEPRAVPM